jgi:3-hydroxyisobutyrate dehydrogenase-like beta-hydroxyacid dehydrogenase
MRTELGNAMKVAWIGLGDVGLTAAKKTAAAGHLVRGFDVRSPKPGSTDGIVLAGSARAAAEDCEVLCIAVFSDDQVDDVLTGPEGVMADLKPGAVVAVFTTGSVEKIVELAASAPAGVTVLDTSFSYMQSDAASGTMAMIVGGDGDAIARARPVFDSFARVLVHVGKSGSGRKLKLVNNWLLAGQLQIVADALRFAEALGLEHDASATALLNCSTECDVLRRYLADGSPAPTLEYAQRYMVKDVQAAAAAAETAGVDLGPLKSATSIYFKS